MAAAATQTRALTPCEQQLLARLAAGEGFYVSAGSPELDSPRNAWAWGPDRTVRAEVLRDALMGVGGPKPTRPIAIAGVLIRGPLELNHARLDASVAFYQCAFTHGLELAGARLPAFRFTRCRAPELDVQHAEIDGDLWIIESQLERVTAGQAHIGGNVLLWATELDCQRLSAFHGYGLTVGGDFSCARGLTIRGAMVLRLARIGGRLQMDDVRLRHPADTALLAEGANVAGDVDFGPRMHVLGGVTLEDGHVGGTLLVSGVKIERPGGIALDGDRLTVQRNLRVEQTRIEGEMRLLNATIGGWLSFSAAHLTSHVGGALIADGATIRGSVLARDGFFAEGEMRLLNAEVFGGVTLTDVRLRNRAGPALAMDACRVHGSVRIDAGFAAHGAVRLPGARIDDQLIIASCTLDNPAGVALSALAARVGVDILCGENVIIDGDVILDGAEVGGQLTVAGTRLRGYARVLTANRIHVGGDMRLGPDFEIEGVVGIGGGEVEGGFTLANCRLRAAGEHEPVALTLQATRVGQRLVLSGNEFDGALDMTDVVANALDDSQQRWPELISLSGFTYGAFAPAAPVDPAWRLDWLRQDMLGGPQPYEQLMDVYRRSGHDDAVRAVGIAKLRRRRESLALASRLWSHFLDRSVGYGYRTWLAVLWLMGLLAVSSLVFGVLQAHHIVPARHGEGAVVPTFNPLMYSLDVLIPLLDLHQRDSWIAQGWVQWLVTGFALTGWLLTTVTVAALTGLLKRE